MDELLSKRNELKGNPTKVQTTKSSYVNKMINQLNFFSFGYIGTIVGIIYNTIMERGIVGATYDIIKSSFFFVNKTQHYPNIVLNHIFGFVSSPFDRLFNNSTKSTLISPQSK
tara:strand:+ start:30 stop:368 length:339 start_codon:yes stop_codon:yes gene_type:complete